jgi:hypothetical protein
MALVCKSVQRPTLIVTPERTIPYRNIKIRDSNGQGSDQHDSIDEIGKPSTNPSTLNHDDKPARITWILGGVQRQNRIVRRKIQPENEDRADVIKDEARHHFVDRSGDHDPLFLCFLSRHSQDFGARVGKDREATRIPERGEISDGAGRQEGSECSFSPV